MSWCRGLALVNVHTYWLTTVEAIGPAALSELLYHLEAPPHSVVHSLALFAPHG